jgi:hypothetical protein
LQYNAFAAEVFTNAESSGDIREYTSGEMDCNKNQRLWHNLFVGGECSGHFVQKRDVSYRMNGKTLLRLAATEAVEQFVFGLAFAPALFGVHLHIVNGIRFIDNLQAEQGFDNVFHRHNAIHPTILIDNQGDVLFFLYKCVLYPRANHCTACPRKIATTSPASNVATQLPLMNARYTILKNSSIGPINFGFIITRWNFLGCVLTARPLS